MMSNDIDIDVVNKFFYLNNNNSNNNNIIIMYCIKFILVFISHTSIHTIYRLINK